MPSESAVPSLNKDIRLPNTCENRKVHCMVYISTFNLTQQRRFTLNSNSSLYVNNSQNRFPFPISSLRTGDSAQMPQSPCFNCVASDSESVNARIHTEPR